MYSFKIKLRDNYNNVSHSYSFPSKIERKSGFGIIKYNSEEYQLGWLKCKTEKEAIRAFIQSLRFNISMLKSNTEDQLKGRSRRQIKNMGHGKAYSDFGPTESEKEMRKKELNDLNFLEDLMIKTECNYLNKFPEAFI